MINGISLASRTLIGAALCLGHATVHAQGFADDFSTDAVNPDVRLFTNALANRDTAATADDTGLLVNVVHADPDGDERAQYEVNTDDEIDSLRATGTFLGERPSVGRLLYESRALFYNSLSDGAAGDDIRRPGSVEIEIGLSLNASPEEDIAEVCFTNRDSNGDTQPLEASRPKCEFFQIAGLDVDTPYTTEIGIDRSTRELYAELNGERITVSSPTPFFEEADRYAYTRFRTRDGVESANFRMSDLMLDGEAVDLSILPVLGRYKTDDFDDFSGDDDRSKEIVDGRLRLSASVADSEGDNVAFLRLAEPNDYIEADLVYSGESSVDTSAGGFAAVRLAGLLYNDVSSETDIGNLGSVFASVMLIENAGSGLVGEYCLIRSDADDFSESTDLADGMDDERCPTFDLAVSPDTVYRARLSLDQEAKTVTFGLGEEAVVYDITTDVFKRDGTLRAQARMANGATGTVVGYVDNLRNDPAARTDEELLASMSGGDGTGAGSGGGSGGGGGCSIESGRGDGMTWLLGLFAAVALLARRRRGAAP